jgi:hypothetical protein
MNINDSFLVGYDYSEENDSAVLIIGRKKALPGQIKILNKFQGTEATALYKMLLAKGEDHATT